MDLNSTSSGTVKRQCRRSRLSYSKSQKDTLQAWFNKNPYPGPDTRERIAKEIGVSEYNIQLWFKNSRIKQKRLESGCSLGKDENQGQGKPQPCTQEYLPEEARRLQTSTMGSQTSIPGQAFVKNQSPDTATRELAKQRGSPEPRVQKWFLNRSDQHSGQSKRESINFLGGSPSGSPDMTPQQHQFDLSTLPGSSYHFLPPNSFCNSLIFLTALPPFHVPFFPWYPFGVIGSQGPCIMKAQTMQAAQGGEQSNSLLTPSLGRDISDTQMPFSPQYQGKCQYHNEHIGREVLQLQDSSQPHPEREKVELHDIAHILRWWDERCLALIAEWEPPKGTLEQAGDTEADLWPNQLRSHLTHLTNRTSNM